MKHPRLLNTRACVAGAASVAALSLLFTSFNPLNGSVAADNTGDNAGTTQAATVSENSDTTAPSEDQAAGTEQNAAAPEAGATPESGVTPDAGATPEENAPRVRRARATSSKPATLAMTVTNDSSTLAIRDKQITTINYACSSVTTPC